MDLLNKLISLDYFSNIINNYNLLKEEFTGVVINPSEILYFFYKILFTALLFFIFYYTGDYLRSYLKFKNKYYSPFVNFALGYIFIGITIALLGFFHLLYFNSLLILMVLAFVISLFRFYKLKNQKKVFQVLKNFSLPKDIYVWIVIIIVGLSFTKLLLPEIHEDGYHTDLPKLYLSSHTIMHPARDPLFVIPYAQLPEIIYILPIAFADKEAARMIHFSFYLLSIFLLYRYARSEKYAVFAPLLFATTPMVMRYASSQYTDFFMIYSFLLSVLIIGTGKTKEKFLSGILFGAVLSSKLWTLIYIPIFVLFIFLKNKKDFFKYTFVFLLGAFVVSIFWQIRDYILTGNPIFPFLSATSYVGRQSAVSSSSMIPNIFRFNLFVLDNFKLLSPLLFLGIFMSIFQIKKIVKNPVFLFFALLTILQTILTYSYGRYLFAWVSLAVIFASFGIVILIKRFKFIKFIVIFLSFVFIFYYSFNTLLLLPYGIGWANKQNYLTRTLIRDNASYYDFDGSFGKFINKDDLVATYEIYSFYYADFNHIDVNFIFDKNNLSFDLLKKNGITRLLIKGGDMKWFCEKLSLTYCTENKFEYLSSYINDHQFFLYKI